MQDKMNEVLQGLGIDAVCVEAKENKHLAFFDLELSKKSGVIKKIEAAAKEIGLHIRAKKAPTVEVISEKGVVRLQCPMRLADSVTLTSLYDNQEMISKIDDMLFPILIGESSTGEKLWMDANDNPHCLIAGATGSGKSVLLQTLAANALYVNAFGMRAVNLYLGDPKRVEFSEYKDESLSRFVTVTNSYEEIVEMLEDIYTQMEYRYESMAKIGLKSLEAEPDTFPVIYCIIDEVSDLVMQDKGNKLETLLCQIAQKGRAAGIFLNLATQRPSVKVITGDIKANFPGRIACRTVTATDSKVILDSAGAENLLGRGDAILQNSKYDSMRFQVSFTTPKENIKKFNAIRNWMEARKSA